jgi:DNA (cytosine-5)-methyltransferase 1
MDIPMKESIKVGSQFSGVGAFEQALDRLNIEYDNVYAADWDKYARQTYLLNYKEPKFYVKDVYDTPMDEIPQLDIAMFSPPCQAFSLAGKRKGEEDDRGVLFYNSHEFITKNKPRYFIFENVKGLLSDDGGKTFQRWIDFLGGKSVNGNPVIFPLEEATPYHVYYQVLNAKNYGIPQNRERIFIIGVRDDADNDFSFPNPFPLVKRLKDVLESEVDEKYFLSDKMIAGLINHQKFNKFNPTAGENESSCITSRVHKMENADNYIDVKKIGYINQDTQASQVISENGIMPNVCAGTHGYALGYVATNEIIQLNNPIHSNDRIYSDAGLSPTLNTMQGGNIQPFVQIGEIRGRNPNNPLSRVSGLPTEQMLEINENGTSNALTTVQKDNVVVLNQQRIRRLTPRECMRLMDFPETFKWDVSDSQAYKQAGNSICVGVLSQIISKLNLKTNSLC